MFCKIFGIILLFQVTSLTSLQPSVFDKDDVFSQPINMMGLKSAHIKDKETDSKKDLPSDTWSQYDFSKFDAYLDKYRVENPDHNRIKRRAKRRHRNNRRRNQNRSPILTTQSSVASSSPSSTPSGKGTETQPNLRRNEEPQTPRGIYSPVLSEFETDFTELPKDLYQAHLRPGVIFRVHMAEAIIKMQYRNYEEDKDESVIEADVEYLRLTRKVISDEITKFEDLIWLISWFNNRTELIQEHYCNTRYFTVGIPPTMFTRSEEYMKRLCIFDNVYLDHIPYVVGEDSSLIAAVAPPVLHCDAATCTSVPFVDSLMFEERYPRTNVRTMTRCQSSCRAHCRNDADCLKRCTDRCYRGDRD